VVRTTEGGSGMRCEHAREALSERMDTTDAPPSGELEGHVQSCATCAEFERIALHTRRALRYGVDGVDGVDAVDDDLTVRVLRAARADAAPAPTAREGARGHGRGWVAAVALFLVCAVAAFALTRGPGGVAPAAADDRAALVARGQILVQSMHARVAMYERGGDGTVTHHADGDISYVAPEGVLLRLSGDDGDVEVGVNGEMAWRRGEVESIVRGREPFDAAGWSALELIVPVDAFGRDGAGAATATLDGRQARVVQTTVAQVEELLAALRTGGSWRPLHPSDVVTLWLDAETAVPRRVEVQPSTDADRATWSARHTPGEPAEGALFVVELTQLQINGRGGAVPAPLCPLDQQCDESRDLGFVDRTVGESELPVPAWLPEGMAEYRSGERRSPGAAATVVMRTWTSGRSWVKVAGTKDWDGDQLFGSIGPLVRPLSTPAGVVYASEDASSIAVHGEGIDLVVTGSVGEADLLRIAASLEVDGLDVPEWWAEAGSTTVDELELGDEPALVPRTDADLDGASVSLSARGGRIDVAVTGPGARGARLVETPSSVLAPSEDPDARVVTVRGVEGRYSPTLGELAWVERQRLIVLSSSTLTVGEMVDVAASLEWVGG
jgi:hypothetical protein